jgi:hypothetical protein
MLEAANRPVDGIRENGEHIAVKYSARVLEEVRQLAVDGFNAFSNGGIETGGILYGIREAGCIRVLSFAELACEHASGPRFLLSEKDRSVLIELLHPPNESETVGWFRTHTRSDLELDAHDREIFDRYFAQPMSVALMLKPTHWGPASAAFFVRGPCGEVLPASPREFVVEPLKPEAATPVSVEDETSTEDELCTEGEPDVAHESKAPPSAELPGHAPKPRRAKAWALCACAVLGTAAAFTFESRPSSKIEFRAHAIIPGQVSIEWNRRPQSVLDGASGVLEIEDGDSVTRLPLNAERLNSGTVTYSQLTGHIKIRVRVEAIKGGAAPMEDTTDFIGPPAPRKPPTEVRRDARPVEAEVAAMPEPPVRGAHAEQLQTRIEARPIPTLPARPIRKAILVAEARTATVLRPAVLPNPPVLEPRPPRPIGLLEVLSAPTFHAQALLPPPSVDSASYRGARSGRLIWTGVLAKRGVIELEGAHVSVGSATDALPGTALSIRVLPAEFSRDGLIVYTADRARAGTSEAPSKSNGWNAMHFRFDDARASALVILETPNRSNNFTRLVVRNEGRDCSVVVVDWNVQ